MKARKALKRLTKAEGLLSNVIDRLSKASNGVGDLIASARESIVRAKSELDSKASSSVSKKRPARTRNGRSSRATAGGGTRISAAAKKRAASARRKGVNVETGESLKKTA